jgi:hypothetical protein
MIASMATFTKNLLWVALAKFHNCGAALAKDQSPNITVRVAGILNLN